MATVHRARDERLERDVAVKILLPNHAGDPVLAARFEREARSLAAAAHPGVVAVFDVDPGDPTAGVEPFFVMELCSGGSLADRIAAGRRLSPDDLIPILISVADGLAGLHARGVVHRDVKPSNILLAPARAKLADFGLARSDATDPSDLTAPGTAVGTMGYLAPDVLAGAAAGPASDVYALGVAAFAGLTGSMPRPAGSIAELVAVGNQAAPLVSSVAPDLGTAFDEPVAAALDPDPANRPDALSFAASLTTALGRWSRARQDPDVRVVLAPADLDATTSLVPMPAGAPAAPIASVAPVTRPTPPRSHAASPATRGNLLAAAVLGAVIAAALVLAANRGPGAGGLGSGSSASLSASASLSPSPSPTSSPTPAPTASVAQRALAALGEVDAAISGSRGDGGLKGKEANELEKRARDIRSALERGDLDAAAKAANGLAEAVDDVADEMSEEAARRLQSAVRAVVEIIRDR
jgi:serine/threonine-protein kinase